MKLELKHIAPYFPYELQLLEEFELNTPDIVTLRGVEIDMLITTLKRFPYNQRLSFYEAKLILRPLSDLTKEITIDRETFIPLVELAKLADCHFKSIPIVREIIQFEEMECNVIQVHYVDNRCEYFEMSWGVDDEKLTGKNDGYSFTLGECNAIHNSYTIYQKLFEWHFDIFNLIKNNLAVDINKM